MCVCVGAYMWCRFNEDVIFHSWKWHASHVSVCVCVCEGTRWHEWPWACFNHAVGHSYLCVGVCVQVCIHIAMSLACWGMQDSKVMVHISRMLCIMTHTHLAVGSLKLLHLVEIKFLLFHSSQPLSVTHFILLCPLLLSSVTFRTVHFYKHLQ